MQSVDQSAAFCARSRIVDLTVPVQEDAALAAPTSQGELVEEDALVLKSLPWLVLEDPFKMSAMIAHLQILRRDRTERVGRVNVIHHTNRWGRAT